MTVEPKTARGKAIVEAAREMADAAERSAIAYERGSVLARSGAEDEAAKARAELDRLVAEWEVLSGPAFEAAALSGSDSIALLVRALHERAQQAELTRDAAQARATACEERARRAEAERDEWRACAEEGARLIKAQHIDSAMAWADAIHIDPSAGTGGHEREPGRNDANG